MPNNLAFPALDNGMLAQLPITHTIERLSRSTKFPDGTVLSAPSETRLRYSWVLAYENLSTVEWQRLCEFISAAKGGAHSFEFADPFGNLLAQSRNLMSPVWISAPGLVIDLIDDQEQEKAFILTNPTSEPATVTQTVNLNGRFRTCFSLLAKWAEGANFVLGLSDEETASSGHFVASGWNRHSIDLSSISVRQTTKVVITVPPMTQLLIACPQLEIGAQPGAYVETGNSSSLFDPAWLAQESFDSQSNAPGAHSITLRIESLRIA